MPSEDDALNLRKQSWNAAVFAYGTGYIFSHRNRKLKRRLDRLTYAGLVVPVVIGLLVLAYGEFDVLPILVGIGAAFTICQVALSLWSIVGGWVAGYAYSTTAIADNYQLAERYAALAGKPPEDFQNFQNEFNKLKIEDNALAQKDYQQGITDEETRMGMRAALRKFSRTCAGCGKTPTDMKAGKCGVCGNFHYRAV